MRKGMTALDDAKLARIHRELAEAYLAMGLKVEALDNFNKALHYLQECPIADVGVAGSNPATPTSDLAGAPANFPTGSPQPRRFYWERRAVAHAIGHYPNHPLERADFVFDIRDRRGQSGGYLGGVLEPEHAQIVVDALNARVP